MLRSVEADYPWIPYLRLLKLGTSMASDISYYVSISLCQRVNASGRLKSYAGESVAARLKVCPRL